MNETEKENDLTEFHLPRWEELPEIDLYMDQVITLMSKYMSRFSADGEPPLTSSMINNYVKHGIIPSPVKKKYSRVHISRLIIICVMKPVLPIQSIGMLIDNLLKTRTEKEVLNFFSSHFEKSFANSTDIINHYSKDMNQGEYDISTMLSLAIMHAAAISGASKLLAESSLAKLNKLNQVDEDEKEKS
ncbi:MAG: DUF1836 domain-containing protein [Oscillospiraceae bacterium]